MKKVILAIILAVSVTGTYAQKKNVSKAKNKALMEVPDFKGAREDIKPALTDSITKKQALTWHVAGTIGYKENEAELKKQMLGQKFDADVKGKAIMESYEYFLKAYELDGLPDAKGKIKPKFQKDIKAKIKEYYTTQANLVAYGAHLFEKKDYPATVKVFETYLGIPELPMMNGELKPDSTYYMIKYYTAIASTNGDMNDKAIAYYEDLKDDGYEELIVHQLLYEEYMKKKDTVNFVKTLKAGFEKFPDEPWFLQNLINYYIFSNQTKDAIVYLNAAIQRDPNKAEYQFIKGNLDENMGNLEDARKAFDRAIEIDPKQADAYAGIGRLIYNKGVSMSDAANEIRDNKLYNAAKKKADAVFAESITYFKKAAELKPAEMEYKRTLKNIYYRLKMDKEYEAIDKEMNQ
ncbi:MAG: tetratricopeptide repeat protein [Paludibacter sp.]|jgi:tetratricopeptide (TPR) repeat protein|nr:tetratricopeptide repeat protein [Paludibacter sp.]MBP8783392.1 tetratricopeptide repeat protein [Paludibacter sp.]